MDDPDSYRCDQCSYVSRCADEASQHWIQVHLTPSKRDARAPDGTVCPVCSQWFSTDVEVQLHFEQEHEEVLKVDDGRVLCRLF
jgi:hypothetical protein